MSDGVHYTTAGLAQSYYWHPKAPVTGLGLSESLRRAYYAGIHNGRLIGLYNVSHNGVSSGDQADYTISPASAQSVFELWCWLPPAPVRVKACIVFAAISSEPASATHQLIAYDSSTATTYNGPSVITQSTVGQYSFAPLSATAISLGVTATNKLAIPRDPLLTQTGFCEVDLSSATMGKDFRFTVKAKINVDATTNYGYRMLGAALWYDIN